MTIYYMKKLLNEWHKFLNEETRVVKPSDATPEAAKKSRQKGLEKAQAERATLNKKCDAAISQIGKGGEEDLPSEAEMACIKDIRACKARCIRANAQGEWMKGSS
jgi:hypothetical protein